MSARIHHLAVVEHGTVEEVRDGGRTIVIGGEEFTLRTVNGRFVRASEPWYGTRAALRPDED